MENFGIRGYRKGDGSLEIITIDFINSPVLLQHQKSDIANHLTMKALKLRRHPSNVVSMLGDGRAQAYSSHRQANSLRNPTKYTRVTITFKELTRVP